MTFLHKNWLKWRSSWGCFTDHQWAISVLTGFFPWKELFQNDIGGSMMSWFRTCLQDHIIFFSFLILDLRFHFRDFGVQKFRVFTKQIPFVIFSFLILVLLLLTTYIVRWSKFPSEPKLPQCCFCPGRKRSKGWKIQGWLCPRVKLAPPASELWPLPSESQLYPQLHYWDTAFFTLRIQILSFRVNLPWTTNRWVICLWKKN